VRANLKEGDYTYISCPIPTKTRIDVLNAQELRATGKCKYRQHREYNESAPGDRPLRSSMAVSIEIVAFPPAAR
jgi:hypothetical protein